MNTSIKSWTRLVEFIALVTAPFVLLVGFVLYADFATSNSSAATPKHAAVKAAPHKIPTFDMTIVTDDQTGRPGYIAYVPSSLSLPAHSTVRIRITNFDDATAQRPAKYARVWGTVGNTIKVQRMMPGMPNMLYRVHTLKALPAATQVSHTFTSPGMNFNVPVAPSGVTTFVLKTGKAGHYTWQCYDPCGSGKAGWGGPMAMRGYMSGTITVA
jgi:heme/copper-type cytochrome/quinol oxidase subunit 2